MAALPRPDAARRRRLCRAESCGSLPPAFIAVADQEPLRDEALLYAMRMLAADVAVELHVYPDTYHVFDMAAPAAPVSQQALADQVRFLSAQLSGAPLLR